MFYSYILLKGRSPRQAADWLKVCQLNLSPGLPDLSQPALVSVVDNGHFKPCWCRVSVELGRGKSLICITVESMTSSIVITLDFLHTNKVYSSILMWISCILIRYRFTNERQARTIKTVSLFKLARL